MEMIAVGQSIYPDGGGGEEKWKRDGPTDAPMGK